MTNRGLTLFGCVAGVVMLLSAALYAANAATTGSIRPLPTNVARYKIDDATGDMVLVPAVDGKRIQVWGVTLVSASATTYTFKSGTTAITGPMTMTAIQIDPPFGTSTGSRGIPWLESESGKAVNLTLGGAVQLSGQVIYSAE